MITLNNIRYGTSICIYRNTIQVDKVWQLTGGFGALPDWLPYIPQSELIEGGRVRQLANPDGSAIVEGY